MHKKHIELENRTILVTGSPGFIGANLVIRLLSELSSATLVSLDNMNGDVVAAKAIVRVNKCIGYYRQINQRAADLRDKMDKKLMSLKEIQAIMDGMDV